MILGTYNARSLLHDDRLRDLGHELRYVKWDIIGLGEVRRHGTDYITLNSGHVVFYSGSESNSRNGVGFLIKRNLAGNI